MELLSCWPEQRGQDELRKGGVENLRPQKHEGGQGELKTLAGEADDIITSTRSEVLAFQQHVELLQGENSVFPVSVGL